MSALPVGTEIPAVRVVPRSGITQFQKLSIGVGALILVVGAIIEGWIDAVGIGKWGVGLPPLSLLAFYLVLVAVVAFIMLVPWLQVARSIELNPRGLVIEYPLRRVSIPWSDLMNVLYVTKGVVTFRRLSFNPKKTVGFEEVTFEQARAILTDPRCPAVSLTAVQHSTLLPS